MPTFLNDPPDTLYLVLFAVVVVTGAVAARNQNRKSLIPFGISLAVLLGLYLLDRLNESPREVGVHQLKEMERAANDRNADAFASHFADTFEYKGVGTARKITREQIRGGHLWDLLRQHNVTVATWDYA